MATRIAATSAAPRYAVAYLRRLAGAASKYVMARRRHSPAVTSCDDVIIYNFYNYYTPFQSARQPSEIINSPSHIFLFRP